VQSRLLRSFLAVAEKCSITEAAEMLNVSQPALTKSMQRLEGELGVKLFDRIAVGVRLTDHGEILLHHVKVMDNEYRHAVARIEALRGGRSEVLRIGAGPVWMVSLLPPIIGRFQAEHSGVNLSLIGGIIDTLVPALANGELDLICASLDFPRRSDIIKHPLVDMRHVLITAPTHPLTEADNVDASDVQDMPWMVLKGDHVGNERISSFFAAKGLKPPHIAFETTSIHSLLQGLRSGEYIAHIPSQMMPLAIENGLQAIKMRKSIWETKAGYAYRTSSTLSEPTKAFIALLNNHDFEG